MFSFNAASLVMEEDGDSKYVQKRKLRSINETDNQSHEEASFKKKPENDKSKGRVFYP